MGERIDVPRRNHSNSSILRFPGKGGAGPLLRWRGDAKDPVGVCREDTPSSQSLSYTITVPRVMARDKRRGLGENGAHNTTEKGSQARWTV